MTTRQDLSTDNAYHSFSSLPLTLNRECLSGVEPVAPPVIVDIDKFVARFER